MGSFIRYLYSNGDTNARLQGGGGPWRQRSRPPPSLDHALDEDGPIISVQLRTSSPSTHMDQGRGIRDHPSQHTDHSTHDPACVESMRTRGAEATCTCASEALLGRTVVCSRPCTCCWKGPRLLAVRASYAPSLASRHSSSSGSKPVRATAHSMGSAGSARTHMLPPSAARNSSSSF